MLVRLIFNIISAFDVKATAFSLAAPNTAVRVSMEIVPLMIVAFVLIICGFLTCRDVSQKRHVKEMESSWDSSPMPMPMDNYSTAPMPHARLSPKDPEQGTYSRDTSPYSY